MKTSEASQLPEYITGRPYITKVGGRARKVVEVTCPRRGCRRTFIVVLKHWWSDKAEFIGRSCPYCPKANRIPRRPAS